MRHDDHVSATRAVYEASAERYLAFAGHEITSATEGDLDRSMLTTFTEMVASPGGARVADLGCGPGRVAALLSTSGLDTVGIDISRSLLVAARSAHPQVGFVEGRIDQLPLAGGALAGAVSWYSIMFTPPPRLDALFVELRRVLAPEGVLLLGFQAGTGDPIHRADAHGTGLPLTVHWHRPADVVRRLASSGFAVQSQAEREPQLPHESTPQAFVIARARS